MARTAAGEQAVGPAELLMLDHDESGLRGTQLSIRGGLLVRLHMSSGTFPAEQ